MENNLIAKITVVCSALALLSVLLINYHFNELTKTYSKGLNYGIGIYKHYQEDYFDVNDDKITAINSLNSCLFSLNKYDSDKTYLIIREYHEYDDK